MCIEREAKKIVLKDFFNAHCMAVFIAAVALDYMLLLVNKSSNCKAFYVVVVVVVAGESRKRVYITLSHGNCKHIRK